MILHGLKRNYYVHLSNTKYCYITKCSNVDIYCRLMSLAQIINLFHLIILTIFVNCIKENTCNKMKINKNTTLSEQAPKNKILKS